MEKRVDNSFSKEKQTKQKDKKIQFGSQKNPLALLMRNLPDNILDLEYSGCLDLTQRSKLRISHWNVNGIRAALKKKPVREYFEQTQLDILCLNETKINKKKFFKSEIQK